MLKRIISTITAVVACCLAVCAQEVCVINGTIENDGKKIKKVTLTRTNELGQDIEVATAKVKKGKYTIKYKLAKDEPVMLYTITGFGEGKDVELFVEPGEVTVVAGNPGYAWGTPANDVLFKYKELCMEEQVAVLVKENELAVKNGREWLGSAEGKNALDRIKAKEAIKNKSARLRFLIDHNDSPMTPLEIERTLLPELTPAYAEQMLKTIALSLQSHPYTLSLRNKVLAGNLKVGNEVPDITLPLMNGETKHLADYRGKYVVLNFWSAACDKSAGMLAALQEMHKIATENPEQFIIISFALDNDIAAWKEAVKACCPESECWLHASDGMGKDSPAAKLLGVEATPKIILIEPEGRAVSLDMDADEIAMRAEQILSGDLYYLDQED